MIASLRGRVIRVEDEWAVLEVGGVGYQVFVHSRTGAVLRAERGEVCLQVHTVVREDAISLYGFQDPEELACFRFLLGVERIGPKAALAILARAEWPDLVEAIVAENYQLLAAVPGVGARTAKRIVLELKGRVDGLARPGGTPTPAPLSGLGDRAVDALVGSGFAAAAAHRAVSLEMAEVDTDGRAERTIEDVVAGALRRLAPGTAGAGRGR